MSGMVCGVFNLVVGVVVWFCLVWSSGLFWLSFWCVFLFGVFWGAWFGGCFFGLVGVFLVGLGIFWLIGIFWLMGWLGGVYIGDLQAAVGFPTKQFACPCSALHAFSSPSAHTCLILTVGSCHLFLGACLTPLSPPPP